MEFPCKLRLRNLRPTKRLFLTAEDAEGAERDWVLVAPEFPRSVTHDFAQDHSPNFNRKHNATSAFSAVEQLPNDQRKNGSAGWLVSDWSNSATACAAVPE